MGGRIYVQHEPSQSGTYRVAWSLSEAWDPKTGDGRSAEFRRLKALDQAGIWYATSQDQRDRFEAEARRKLKHSDVAPVSTPRPLLATKLARQTVEILPSEAGGFRATVILEAEFDSPEEARAWAHGRVA